MNNLPKFNYDHSMINKSNFSKYQKKLQPEIINMQKALKSQYATDYASIFLPDDKSLLKKIKSVVKEKKKLNPKYIIVVGIGGSNLGTIAVQEAVKGKLYNQLDTKTKILYADTVDSDLIASIIKIIEPVLKKGHNVIVNGISKSGGTTETIANFQVFVNLIKKYKKNYQKYVVITTDKGSKFWNLANEKGFEVFDLPKKVGGRYSVLSAVGLFPLSMIGINVDKLLAGAKDMRNLCLKQNVHNNPAAKSAIIQYAHHKKNKPITISNLFLFSNDLEHIGKWYRQLMGESIGKEFSKQGKKVFAGITPTVSIGSTDLHSMAQLYLGGPYDKFHTIVGVENNYSSIKLPKLKGYDKLVSHIQGKKLEELMNAILKGVKIAYQKNKRPYLDVILNDKSEYSIGAFLQFKMIEMMYLGYLMNVNPFDQPNVEKYKIETKKILSKK